MERMPAPDLDWQQLKGFYHIAKLGNVTRAAEAMFRTQSALSQQIKALEESIGYRLFTRIGKQGMVLTPEGETLLRFAEDVLARQTRLMQDLETLQDESCGRVRLGAAPTIAHSVLPDLIAAFRQDYPRVTVSVFSKMPADIIGMVKSGFLDLGMTLESMIPQNVVIRRWRRNRYMLMTPKDHPLARGGTPSLEEIFSHPIIVTANSKFAARRKFEFVTERMGATPDIMMECSNALTSAEYVKRGLALCFMSMPEAVPAALEGELAFIPLDAYFEPEFVALYHREGELSAPARAFLENTLARSAEPGAEEKG